MLAFTRHLTRSLSAAGCIEFIDAQEYIYYSGFQGTRNIIGGYKEDDWELMMSFAGCLPMNFHLRYK
jgi:hypothetical protein